MKRPGISIIEIIIALGLVTVIVGILTSLIIQSQRTYTLEASESQIQLRSQSALSRISREAKQALTVLANYSTYTTDTDTLILQLYAVDTNEVIIPSTYDIFVYERNPADPTKLSETIIPGSGSSRPAVTRSIAGSVTDFTISYFDGSSNNLTTNLSNAKRITLELVAREQAYGQTVEKTYSEQTTLRNK